VDFVITLGMLAGLMLWYGFAPGWQLASLPLFVLLAFGLALGLGLFFAALNVTYRDFRYVVPFIVQFGLFISPIAFTAANVPERWRAVYSMNPLVGIIEGFRWAILGGRVPFDAHAVGVSISVTVSFLVLGVWYFRRMERNFADVI
jgi:lipopolysaccharide transport system permease protein